VSATPRFGNARSSLLSIESSISQHAPMRC
jgi:hypothetical protein